MTTTRTAVPLTDLRKSPVDDVLDRFEHAFSVRMDRNQLVRKRRSVGGPTDRRTWLRMELRATNKITEQRQPADGAEASSTLRGVARPQWYGAVSWHDVDLDAVWRGDEMELVEDPPIRSHVKSLHEIGLPQAWWSQLNTSLDRLAQQCTTRVATPDTQPLTRQLAMGAIGRAFPSVEDATPLDEEWLPAHGDLNWSNLTGPSLCILDWEDFGSAPRGLDAANLWISSVSAPALAERVHAERRRDLESPSGQLMTLFVCAKVLDDSSLPEPVRQATVDAARYTVERMSRR